MRSLLVALGLLLVAAAPAAAGYTRLPVPPADRVALAAGQVYVSSGASLLAVSVDGQRVRPITLPRTPSMLDYVTVSSQGIAVGVFPRRSYYRAHGGPWHEVPDNYAQTVIDGARVSVLHESRFDDKHNTIELIDVRGGPRRTYKVYADRPNGVTFSGRYFSYMIRFAVIGGEKIVVRSVATGREVYRVRPGSASNWRMLSGGRLLVLTPAGGHTYRVSLASPGAPRLRGIRSLGLVNADIAVAGGEIALLHGDARALGEVALMGFDGRLRAITPLVQGLEEVEYDGRTVVFTVGSCVFAGPVPTVGAAVPPVDTSGCVREG
jgi:hypothetical protein